MWLSHLVLNPSWRDNPCSQEESSVSMAHATFGPEPATTGETSANYDGGFGEGAGQ